jgi:HIV Tat-specific factor 1
MVKFKSPEDAQRCVAMMNERKFGGTQISCVFYDGVTDYRAREVREAAAHPTTESVDEQEKNLNDYADWLEAESTDEELAADEGDD